MDLYDWTLWLTWKNIFSIMLNFYSVDAILFYYYFLCFAMLGACTRMIIKICIFCILMLLNSTFQRSHLQHWQFGLEEWFSSESNVFQFADSKFYYVLITILTVETDSAPSKTLGTPIILEFDNCNLNFEKNWSNFFKIVLEKIIIFNPNHLCFRLYAFQISQ